MPHHKLKVIFIALSFGLFGVIRAYAQTGTVPGKAVDQQKGIRDVYVKSWNGSKQRWEKPAWTGENGEFTLTNQETGQLHLILYKWISEKERYFATAQARVVQTRDCPPDPNPIGLKKKQIALLAPRPFDATVYLALIRFSDQDPPAKQPKDPNTIAGVIFTSGQIIPVGARVRVTKIDTNTDVPVGVGVQQQAGRLATHFETRINQIGDYELSIFADGFEPVTHLIIKHPVAGQSEGGISIFRSDGTPVLELQDMKVALEQSTAEKEDQTIQLTSAHEAAKRYVFLSRQMQALPISGTRSFDSFALLVPGVLPPPETFSKSGPGISAGVGTAGQFSVNGLRSRENNFTVDGSDNNDEDVGVRRQGFLALVPQPIESLQEFQIITALADARFGRNIGGQVNALTKSGSSEIHGMFYGFLTSDELNARDFFDQKSAGAQPLTLKRTDGKDVILDGRSVFLSNPADGKDQFKRSQFGFMNSGPLSEHAFFFSSFEMKRIRARKESHFAVPTTKQRGVFETGETGFVSRGRFGIPPPFPLYPASVPGAAIFSLYPFPNNLLGPYGENTYTSVLPADGRAELFSAKLDRQFGEIDSTIKRRPWSFLSGGDVLTGRYSYTQDKTVIPVTGGALFSSIRPDVHTHNFAFFLNRTLSRNVADTIRFSFGRTKLSFAEVRDPFLSPSGFLPGTPFLLNAPLLLNVTSPPVNQTTYLSASSLPGTALLSSLGYSQVTQSEQITGPLGQVIMTGFSPIGVDVYNFPQSRANLTLQVADTITYARGSNVYTFGFDIRKSLINDTLERNFRPLAVFNGLRLATRSSNLPITRPDGSDIETRIVSGSTLAAMGAATGLFQTLALDPDSSIGIRFTQFNFFTQVERRIRPNFRLILGMRYEYNHTPETVGERVEKALDPVELNRQAQAAALSCDIPIRCADLVSSLTAAFPSDFKVSFDSNRSNFDARIGFAWNLFGDNRTTLRGGFATYSGQFPAIVIDQSRNTFPSFLPLNIANFSPRKVGQPTFLFNLANPNVQQLDSTLKVITPGTLNRIQGINPLSLLTNSLFDLRQVEIGSTIMSLDLVLPQRELQPPFSMQSAVTLEHQFHRDYLAAVSYVWTRGLKLLRVSTPDLGLNRSGLFSEPIGSSRLLVDSLTPTSFPFFRGELLSPQTNIISKSFSIARTFFESSAASGYHSLQVEFRKRYSYGFQFGSAFTFSNSTDDASDFFDTAGAFALPQNSLNRSERGPSSFDARVRSATNFIIDLPSGFPFGKSRAGSGGWQLAGIFTAQTGQPFTINSAFDNNHDGNLTDRLNSIDALVRYPVAGNNRFQLGIAKGVDPMSLLAPDGLNGAIGRNTFRTPKTLTFDLSVTKSFSPTETDKFFLRVEIFNLLNRANFGVPVRILESPGFGNSISTTTPPRMIQLGLKYSF